VAEGLRTRHRVSERLLSPPREHRNIDRRMCVSADRAPATNRRGRRAGAGMSAPGGALSSRCPTRGALEVGSGAADCPPHHIFRAGLQRSPVLAQRLNLGYAALQTQASRSWSAASLVRERALRRRLSSITGHRYRTLVRSRGGEAGRSRPGRDERRWRSPDTTSPGYIFGAYDAG